MNKMLVLLALVMLVMIGSGCARESRTESSQNAQISMTAIPFPAAVGESRLVIQVTDLAGQPVSDAALSIKGDMTHAGMAPVLAEVRGGDDEGYYEIPFEWTMAGDWVVTVEAILSDGAHVKERFDFSVLSEDEALCTDDDAERTPVPTASPE
ncbi:MAG: FixH family protein [Candidatus Promineifilaceae bacterium]|jgi:hypothetical protein